jgi:polyphosphate kinase 2 (PPK2 family)
LADDGALVLKFWMHLNRDVQEERLKRLEKDPLRQWRVKPVDWENWELYDRFLEAAGIIISRTNTGRAPWMIVDGEDYHYRSLAVGERLLEAMDTHLRKAALRRHYQEQLDAERGAASGEPIAPVDGNGITVFDTLDLSLRLEKDDYKERLKKLQARLAVLHGKAVVGGKTSILVFEGPDASGKGGAIRRMVRLLDARTYSIQPVAAPTDEEIARQYLWRF